MGLMNRERSAAAVSIVSGVGIRPRPPRRFVSEFESEIRELYSGMMEEPIPPRLIGILRAGLSGPKS